MFVVSASSSQRFDLFRHRSSVCSVSIGLADNGGCSVFVQSCRVVFVLVVVVDYGGRGVGARLGKQMMVQQVTLVSMCL